MARQKKSKSNKRNSVASENETVVDGPNLMAAMSMPDEEASNH